MSVNLVFVSILISVCNLGNIKLANWLLGGTWNINFILICFTEQNGWNGLLILAMPAHLARGPWPMLVGVFLLTSISGLN